MRPQLQQADGGVTRPAKSWEMGLPEEGCSWGKLLYSVLSPEQFWGHITGPSLMASQRLSPGTRLGMGCLHPSLPRCCVAPRGQPTVCLALRN